MRLEPPATKALPISLKAVPGVLRAIFFSVALACYLPAASAESARAQKRNIIFIVVDDLRPELGCYVNDYVKSPNIDALAKAGMVFNRAYCQQAVCSPSRSSLLTGTRPDTTKVWDLKTHFLAALPEVVTLGQHFKQNQSKVDAVELYDHQTDPQENVNIAKDPARAKLVQKLMQQWKTGWLGAKSQTANELKTSL